MYFVIHERLFELLKLVFLLTVLRKNLISGRKNFKDGLLTIIFTSSQNIGALQREKFEFSLNKVITSSDFKIFLRENEHLSHIF